MIVIITTVTTVYSLKKIHPMSELLCANIEALSTGEDDGYIRNEHGCIIWPAITCFGIVVTPEGSFAADFPDSRNWKTRESECLYSIIIRLGTLFHPPNHTPYLVWCLSKNRNLWNDMIPCRIPLHSQTELFPAVHTLDGLPTKTNRPKRTGCNDVESLVPIQTGILLCWKKVDISHYSPYSS